MHHILFHLSTFVYLVGASKTCYYPSGDVAVDDVPCFSGDADSPCCSKNSICLSNGFCYGIAQPFTLSRGSCTNSNWPKGGVCDDKCSEATEMRAEGCALPLYQYIDGKPYYCANAVTLNSSGGLGCYAGSPFTLNSGELVWDKAALTNYTLSDNSSKSTSNSSSSSSNSASNSNGTLNNKNTNGNDNDVAIGAGVGVPLGVLLLTALGWALYERKKRHSLQALVTGLQSEAAVAQLSTYGNTPAYTPLRELPDTQKPPQELATSERRV